MVTIEVDEEVWRRLTTAKNPGDSFNHVLRRELGLDDRQPDVEEHQSEPDDVKALLAEWTPRTQANDERARRETVRAYRWLAEQSEPQKRSEIVAACAGDSELGERSWWERAVQPGLRYLVEKGYVEYRSGYHDYSASGR
jgi:predicted CopG family antitoxin